MPMAPDMPMIDIDILSVVPNGLQSPESKCPNAVREEDQAQETQTWCPRAPFVGRKSEAEEKSFDTHPPSTTEFDSADVWQNYDIGGYFRDGEIMTNGIDVER